MDHRYHRSPCPLLRGPEGLWCPSSETSLLLTMLRQAHFCSRTFAPSPPQPPGFSAVDLAAILGSTQLPVPANSPGVSGRSPSASQHTSVLCRCFLGTSSCLPVPSTGKHGNTLTHNRDCVSGPHLPLSTQFQKRTGLPEWPEIICGWIGMVETPKVIRDHLWVGWDGSAGAVSTEGGTP